MTEEQELNRKIAKFAGISDYDPHIMDAPDFTNSLNALFKWAVPALPSDIRLRMLGQKRDGKGYFCAIGGKFFAHHYTEAETPALALSLAIEKLIDGG